MAILRTDFVEQIPELRDSYEIIETIGELSLRSGETYVSLGIGRNLLPLTVALQGISVTGVDIDSSALNYQTQIAERYARQLKESGGSLKIYNYNFDDPCNTRENGFRMLDSKKFCDFDIVECVFFNPREGPDDLAQILLNASHSLSRFFVSMPGILGGENALVKALQKYSVYHRKTQLEVIAEGLCVSTTHSNNYGVILKPTTTPQ